MSLGPEQAPKRVGVFVAFVTVAVLVFVVTLAVTAYATRYSSSPVAIAPSPRVNSSSTHGESRLVDAGTTPRAPIGRLDAGTAVQMAAPGNRLVDAGSVPAALAIDAGAAQPKLPAPPVFDGAMLSEQVGPALAGCIRTALAQDPSAGIRVTLWAEANGEEWAFSRFAPTTSPYFRRCAQKLSIAATDVVRAQSIAVDRNGLVVIAP